MRDSPTTPDAVRDLEPIVVHDGLSGADLFSASLTDGTPVIVKRSLDGRDLFQELLGHRTSLELTLWRDGVLDRLPPGVASATIGGWADEQSTWIVMRDLRGRIIGADHPYDRDEIAGLLERLDRLHRSGLTPTTSTSLEAAVGMFAPARVALTPSASEIGLAIDAGWEAFRAFAPTTVADAVIALARDPRPLSTALAAGRGVFCHGDVAGVNMAWDADELVLLDWGQATFAPPAYDVARFLPTGLRGSEISNDELLEINRTTTGVRFNSVELELSLLAAFVWYGWQKSLDAAEGSDPATRQWEVDRLAWWCERLPSGLRHLG